MDDNTTDTLTTESTPAEVPAPEGQPPALAAGWPADSPPAAEPAPPADPGTAEPLAGWCGEVVELVELVEAAHTRLQDLHNRAPTEGTPHARLPVLLNLWARLACGDRLADTLAHGRAGRLETRLRPAGDMARNALFAILAGALRGIDQALDAGAQAEGRLLLRPADFGVTPQVFEPGRSVPPILAARADPLRADHPARQQVLAADLYRLGTDGRGHLLLGQAGASAYFLAEALDLTARWRRDQVRQEEERARAEEKRKVEAEAAMPREYILERRIQDLERQIAEALPQTQEVQP